MLSSLLVSAALALGQTAPLSTSPVGGTVSTPFSSSAATAPRVAFGTPTSTDSVPVATPNTPLLNTYPLGLSVVQTGNGATEKTGTGAEEPKKDGKEQTYTPGFLRNFLKAYKDEFFPKKNG